MNPIDECQEVRPDLFYWSGYEPAVKAELSCCAVALAAGLVFVDPLPLAREPLEALVSRFRPAAIILTNENHERHAAHFARRLGVPIHAHREAQGEIGADHWHDDGALILGEIRLIHLPGFVKGEIALHRGRYLLCGDALINLEPGGFAPLPDKYCLDPKLARASLQKLLVLSADLELMTFAHGLPIVSGAPRRLAALLSTLSPA